MSTNDAIGRFAVLFACWMALLTAGPFLSYYEVLQRKNETAIYEMQAAFRTGEQIAGGRVELVTGTPEVRSAVIDEQYGVTISGHAYLHRFVERYHVSSGGKNTTTKREWREEKPDSTNPNNPFLSKDHFSPDVFLNGKKLSQDLIRSDAKLLVAPLTLDDLSKPNGFISVENGSFYERPLSDGWRSDDFRLQYRVERPGPRTVIGVVENGNIKEFVASDGVRFWMNFEGELSADDTFSKALNKNTFTSLKYRAIIFLLLACAVLGLATMIDEKEYRNVFAKALFKKDYRTILLIPLAITLMAYVVAWFPVRPFVCLALLCVSVLVAVVPLVLNGKAPEKPTKEGWLST